MFFSLLSNISKLLNFVRPNIFDDNAIPPEPFTPFFFRDLENDDGCSTVKKKIVQSIDIAKFVQRDLKDKKRIRLMYKKTFHDEFFIHSDTRVFIHEYYSLPVCKKKKREEGLMRITCEKQENQEFRILGMYSTASSTYESESDQWDIFSTTVTRFLKRLERPYALEAQAEIQRILKAMLMKSKVIETEN